MRLRYQDSTPTAVYAALAASCVLVFSLDCVTPHGWADWVLYLTPVALTQLTGRTLVPVAMAGLCTALLVAGYMLSPTSALSEVGLYNRAFGFVVVWSVALITRQVILTRSSLRKKEWLNLGQVKLAEVVRGEQRPDQLATAVTGFLASFLDAQLGAIYRSEAGQLQRLGGFALDADTDSGRPFRLGEGLVGQVAQSRSTVVVRDVPAGYSKVRSGLGAREPRELLLAPLTADGSCHGVVELGFFQSTLPEDVELLGLLSEPIGIALRTAVIRQRVQELLEETQQQAEELETQQEELRVNNEELEQSAETLRQQQASLEQQQAELEQTNVQLEEHAQLLVAQKAELVVARDDLSRKAAELDAASRYKSEFLANMSHELRTPLNSSLILAKLLADNREGNLSPQQIKFAESIYAAGNDLLDLINDVLDLSKIEAGMMEIKREVVRLPRLVETLGQIFQPLASDKHLELSLRIEPGAPAQLTSDPQRLKQILKNLLANALKFTEKGRVGLTIGVAPSGNLRFSVEDTGIGIDPSQHQLVFEAFRQAHGGANRKFGGTGLGLSISRDLARLLGGDITLESEPGRGSTFRLELPLEADAQRPAPSPALAADSAPPPPARESRVRAYDVEDDRESVNGSARVLLVVEDDPAFARALVELARGAGFKVVATPSADEGVELALRHKPAAILLDIHLPDHSGLTVLDRLKRMPATRHIPVQVVSAQDNMQTALEMGAAGYMLKPVERDKLVEALHNLERKSAQGVRSVLIVEDDPLQRESICSLLSAEDIKCVPVGSTAEALEQLRSATHDCVVLDLTLPDGSGYELLERMAEDDAYSFPPVIIYTGRSLSSDDERRLSKYSKSIIIKGARSPERLLDEVTLFLHQVETRLPPDRQRMLAEARSREKAFDGRRVLLVEDDVRNVFALTSVLEQRGAKLRIARNGREALSELEKDPAVDMVLMDIMMPDMDGLTAMRHIRAQPGLAKLPIIALTAKAMRDDQEQCLAAGANDYIAKPIQVDKLLSLMRVWMAN
jgi:CheY-like chemotaxis protein/signal transduction histidine kinase